MADIFYTNFSGFLYTGKKSADNWRNQHEHINFLLDSETFPLLPKSEWKGGTGGGRLTTSTAYIVRKIPI